jgi:hypothetical protein
LLDIAAVASAEPQPVVASPIEQRLEDVDRGGGGLAAVPHDVHRMGAVLRSTERAQAAATETDMR